jgi:hypothetical protein
VAKFHFEGDTKALDDAIRLVEILTAALQAKVTVMVISGEA